MKTPTVPSTLAGRSLPSTPDPARRRVQRWPTLVAIVLTLSAALLLTLALPVTASGDAGDRASVQGRLARSLTVTHGPVVTTLTTSGSDGHQLGDLRVLSLPLSSEGGEEGAAGRIDASLLTTGIDQPNPGDEIRISTLVFTLGNPADQVVVTGSGLYPAAGSTIAIDSTIVRPIVGGSGRFAGVTGWADSEHLADDSWRHTLHVMVARPGATFRDPPAWQRRADRGDRDRGDRGDRGQRERAEPSGRPSAPEPAIIRTPLGQTEPATAEGETLGLWHYLIPAGAALPPHTHPGTQVARIVSGVLDYEVVSGEARVTRADGSSETVVAGSTVTLQPGDTVIEPPGMVHFGSNDGRRPVVLVSATLFETGAEPATAVEVPAGAPESSAAPLAIVSP